jgi:hypothetical protein
MYGALIFSVFIEISSYPEEFFERSEEITFSIPSVVILLKLYWERDP